MLNSTIATRRRSCRSRPQPRFLVTWLMPCLLASSLLPAASCSEDVTAIVVEVTSRLAKSEIDRVVFRVTGPRLADAGAMRSADLNMASFPLTMAIVPGGTDAGPLTVTVEGWLGTETAPRCQETKTNLSFRMGEVIKVSMALAIPANGGVDAGADSGPRPGVDSGSGKDGGTDAGPVMVVDADSPVEAGVDSAGPDVPPPATDAAPSPDGALDVVVSVDASLPDMAATDARLDLAPGADGGVDARADAAPGAPSRDATIDSTTPVDAPRDTTQPREAGTGGCGTAPGCACQADCPEGTTCRCAGGCGCTLTCQKNKNCNATCSGAGTQCTVNSVGVSNSTVTCSGGANCAVDGTGKSSNVVVDCQGGSCTVDCSGADNCDVTCHLGALCVLQCNGASNCAFETCSAGMMTCPGNIKVCNRPCP